MLEKHEKKLHLPTTAPKMFCDNKIESKLLSISGLKRWGKPSSLAFSKKSVSGLPECHESTEELQPSQVWVVLLSAEQYTRWWPNTHSPRDWWIHQESRSASVAGPFYQLQSQLRPLLLWLETPSACSSEWPESAQRLHPLTKKMPLGRYHS